MSDHVGRRAGWALLGTTALLFAVTLFGDIGSRAFDPGDPANQLYHADVAAARFRERGIAGWLDAVVSDPMAKPLQTAILSAALLAGLPSVHFSYQRVTGLMALAVFVLLVAAAWRWLGLRAAVAAAVALLSSNIVLEQAYYGGHAWYGLLFLWAGALCGLSSPPAPLARSKARLAAAGALLAAAVLANYHMAVPAAAAIGLALAECAREAGGRGALRLAAPLIAGAAAPMALVAMAGLVSRSGGYWAAVAEFGGKAARDDPRFHASPAYFLELLADRESWLFCAALAASVAAGGRRLWRRWRGQSDRAAAFLLLWPAATAALLSLPGYPRLERVWLTEFLLLLVPAAVGVDEALGRVAPRWRLAAGAAAALLLSASNARQRAATFDAFHAGLDIRAVLAQHGCRPPIAVLGRAVPYAYLGGSEVRVGTLDQLRQLRGQGFSWVLVSALSGWGDTEFMSRPYFDVPVEALYASRAPYIEVPGVESLGFERFTSFGLYDKIARGAIRFPRPNRLYRIDGLLAACR